MTAASRARGEGGIVFARFSPNSGNVTGIALEQERRDTYLGAGHGFVRNLAELEVRLAGGPADCVAFVDDQFASGGQASAQILHWAGVPRERWPAAIQGERNIDMSAPGDRTLELLRSGRVRLMFVHGTESGRTRVVETARSAGFADLDVVFDRLIPASPILSGPLREFLAEVGRGLLRAIRHGDAPVDAAADAALAADAVGYGGIGSVMVTPTSAPSHAITALWCPGAYAGQPWLPPVPQARVPEAPRLRVGGAIRRSRACRRVPSSRSGRTEVPSTSPAHVVGPGAEADALDAPVAGPSPTPTHLVPGAGSGGPEWSWPKRALAWPRRALMTRPFTRRAAAWMIRIASSSAEDRPDIVAPYQRVKPTSRRYALARRRERRCCLWPRHGCDPATPPAATGSVSLIPITVAASP
ncbi:hypothetical protein SR39_30795 [Methylobacterium radiotolerans]|nr:hypothetical protein SR39_30795 [Methylobacterium radiotolerans]